MRKPFLLLAFIAIILNQGMAQNSSDDKLNQIIGTVATLRQDDKTAWNNALVAFKSDDSWTMMDEILRDDNECWLIGNAQFKLNSILNQCDGNTEKMLPGDFLNGNNPNFNYSLTERGIKKGCTVSYEMKYREGKQVFVVMPYDIGKVKDISFEMFLNGQSIGTGRLQEDGNLYLTINQAVRSSDILRLVITNHSSIDMPVVIINYNTRYQD